MSKSGVCDPQEPEGFAGHLRCHYVQEQGPFDLCEHPQVRLSALDREHTLCRTCQYFQPLAVTPLPIPSTSENWSWSVGMTTAPRRVPTLAASLSSVAAAGWSDLRLFAEPDTQLPEEWEHLPITRRDQVLGAYPNWLLGLQELYLRQPHADAYLMFQDDLCLAAETRRYLEQVLWPRPSPGIVSLYCPSHHGQTHNIGFHREDPGWGAWGALAYVFTPEALLRFLSDFKVLRHRRHGRADGLKNIDSVAGEWCVRTGLAYYVHVPSLVQHTGSASTLYPRAGALGRRRASDPLVYAPLHQSALVPQANEHSTRRGLEPRVPP